MPKVLFEGVSGQRFCPPIHGAGVFEVARRVELVASLDHADGHTIRELARHHDVVPDLDPVHELVELCREVAKAVPTLVGQHFLKMGEYGVTATMLCQIAHLEESWKQLALVDGRKLPLAMCPRPDDP